MVVVQEDENAFDLTDLSPTEHQYPRAAIYYPDIISSITYRH